MNCLKIMPKLMGCQCLENEKVVIKIWNKNKNNNKIEHLNKIIFEEYNPEIIYITNNLIKLNK